MRRQIYGGNIKHIEPHHVRSLIYGDGDSLAKRLYPVFEPEFWCLRPYVVQLVHRHAVGPAGWASDLCGEHFLKDLAAAQEIGIERR